MYRWWSCQKNFQGMGAVADPAGHDPESNPFAGAAPLSSLPRNQIRWRPIFFISTHFPRNNRWDVSGPGEEGGLEVTQLGTGFQRSSQCCQLLIFGAGFLFPIFPLCVRWYPPIGKQVWPTLRDPSSTSRWSSSSQSSMLSSPSRWSHLQNVLQANRPQDVLQVNLDRRRLSWCWWQQPNLPSRFFHHHPFPFAIGITKTHINSICHDHLFHPEIHRIVTLIIRTLATTTSPASVPLENSSPPTMSSAISPTLLQVSNQLYLPTINTFIDPPP